MMRMLQPSEIRRAMSFPDGYQFPDVTRREKIKLLGNAVCSKLMQEIVTSLCAERLTSQQIALPQAVEHVWCSGARPRPSELAAV